MISKPLPDALYPFMICLKPEKRYPFRAEPPHIGHYGEYNPPPPLLGHQKEFVGVITPRKGVDTLG